jgi:hypothetical protein
MKMNERKSFGSVLLVALLAIMLLAALAAVIASSISAKSKIRVDYLQKVKIHYLAESANAIARNKLLKLQDTRNLENIKDKMFEGGIISIQIIQLDAHLWEIEAVAEDINHMKKVKISNIVIPRFEYSLYAGNILMHSKSGNLFNSGKICSLNIQEGSFDKMTNACPPYTDLPQLNNSFFTSLIPFPSKDVAIINEDNYILDGKVVKIEPKIYLATKNLTIKNVSTEASFISLAGDIIINENCYISKYKNYPAVASLRNNIQINTMEPISVDGLIYAKNVFINGSINVKGAIYAQNSIIIDKKDNSKELKMNVIFDESVLQTKGLTFKWDSFKNLSWKVISQ